MDYQCLYTAGAANTVSHGVLWVAEGGVNTTPVSFVAYALYNQVAIVDTNSKTVVCTLLGDVATTKVRVNALTSCTVNINHSKANAHDVNSYCTIVAAAFEDGTVEVWYHLWGDTLRKWYRFDSTLEGLKGSTSAFTSYALPVQADVDDTAGNKSSVTRIPDIGGEGYFFVTAADSTGLVITWCCALHSQASDVSVNDKIVEDHKDASSSSPEILESSVYLVDMFKLPPAQMARSLHLQVLPSGDGSASTASASPAVGTVTGTSTGSGNDTTRSNGSSSTRSSSDHFAGGRVEVIGYIALFIGAVDARIRVYTAPILPLTHHRRATGNHNSSSSGTNTPTGTIDTSTTGTGTGSGTVRSLFTPAGALQGHEEWVTCLSTRMVGNHTLLLASGSQDSKIRVWTLKVQHVQQQFSPPSLSSSATAAVEAVAVDLGKLSLDSANVGELVNEEEEDDDDDDDDNVNEGDIVPAKAADDDDATDATEARLQFRVQQQQGQQCRTLLFSVFLESLLIGHEDWVTSVHWMPFHEALDTTTTTTTTITTNKSIGYGTNGNKEGLEEKKDDAFAGYRLFSTSMDRNMVIWGVDASAGGIWVPMTRMGDMGGTLGGSIGGNLLGFVAGCVAPPLLNMTKLTANNKDNSNNSIHNCDDNTYDTTSTQSAISLLAVGYGGSFHLWSSSDGSDSSSSDGSRNHSGENDEDTQDADPKSSRWVPVPFLTGHFGAVNDLCWCTDQLLGDYIITASSDQTCRVFAPTRCDLKNNHAYRSVNDSNSDDRASGTEKWNTIMSSCNWREVSRPEIHGYDLNCVVHHPMPQRNQQQQQQKLQDLHTGSARVVYSAGEEKLIRVFEAPNSVLKGMLSLCQGKKRHDEQGDCEGGRDSGSGSAAIAAAAGGGGAASFGGDYDSLLPLSLGRIDQAYIPELGLSNKALEFMSEQEQQEHEARSVSHLTWEAPPLESQLADLTLWPETKKLFGHSNEVMCLAIGQHIDTRVTWMASASKARDASSARILLWKCEPTRMNNVPINGGTSSGSSSEPTLAAATTVGEMQLVSKLEGHDSTVVCLSFSPDGRYLVSSGKDRTLCLYHHCSRAGTGAGGVSATYDTFEPVLVIKSAHKRIVWDCTWSPDGKFVFTVSRDGFCKVWQLLEETDKDSTNAGSVGAGMPSLVNVHTFAPMNGIRSGTIAVTAVAVRAAAGTNGGDVGAIGGYFVVVGTEGGDILLWRMNAVLVPTRVSSSAGSSDPKEAEEAALAEVATEIQIQMQLVLQVPQIHRHGCTVKRLRWQPSDSHQQTQQLLPVTLHWASVGEDNTVRVHKVTLNL